MTNLQTFVMVVGSGSLISFLATLFYLFKVIQRRELRTFQTSLFLGFVISDLMIVLGASLRFGVAPSSYAHNQEKGELLCVLGDLVFYFFNLISPIYALVICLTFSGVVRVQKNWFFKNLEENFWFKLASHLFPFSLSFLLLLISFSVLGLPKECERQAEISYVLNVEWLICTLLNGMFCFQIFLLLRSLAKRVHGSQKKIWRIVLSIALMVGFLRIPAFVFGFVFEKGITFEGMNKGVFVGLIISFLLTVSQPFFVVLLITLNQRLCSCLSPSSSFSSSYGGEERHPKGSLSHSRPHSPSPSPLPSSPSLPPLQPLSPLVEKEKSPLEMAAEELMKEDEEENQN